MIDLLKAFLKHLALNRNVSPHTVRAYESDLSQFIAHAAAGAGIKRSELAPAQLDRAAIRRFLGETLLSMPGVRETRTYAVMEEIKRDAPLPVD